MYIHSSDSSQSHLENMWTTEEQSQEHANVSRGHEEPRMGATQQLFAEPYRGQPLSLPWFTATEAPGYFPNPTAVPSEFFTMLAQYHAYAIARAQETRLRRQECLQRFRQKKQRRNQRHIVKYQTRKELAEKRIRGPRGRFIRKEEENRILDSQRSVADESESYPVSSSPDDQLPRMHSMTETFISPRISQAGSNRRKREYELNTYGYNLDFNERQVYTDSSQLSLHGFYRDYGTFH